MPRTNRATGRTMRRKNRWRSNAIIRDASVVEVSHDVEEHRRRVSEAVEAIEDAAMAGQHGAAVLDANVALDGGDGDVADEARGTDEEADGGRRAQIERRQQRRQQDREQRGRDDAADEPFPGLA